MTGRGEGAKIETGSPHKSVTVMSVRGGDGEKGMDSGCNMKGELTAFADGVRPSKEDPKLFA